MPPRRVHSSSPEADDFLPVRKEPMRQTPDDLDETMSESPSKRTRKPAKRLRVDSSSPEPESQGPQAKRRRAEITHNPSELFEDNTTSEQDNETGTSQHSLAEEEEDGYSTPEEHRISQTEVDDLRLSKSPSPASPRTTRQVRRQENIDSYTRQRQRKQAGLSLEPSDRTNLDELEHSQSSELGDDEGTQDNGGSESENFIAPESDADSNDNSGSFAVDDVQHPSGTEDTHDEDDDEAPGPNLLPAVKQFLTGIVKLEFKSTLPVTDAAFNDFRNAKDALHARISTFTTSLAGTFWLAPFKYTLDKRPHLAGPRETSHDRDCDVCYTAGRYGCRTSYMGMSILSTAKGFYDPQTFYDLQETGQQYNTGTAVDLEKRTEAQKMLYPPGFRLVVGERCAKQASQYHHACHRLYFIAQRIRHEVDDLRERYPGYNEEDMLKTLQDDRLAEELWSDLRDDLAHWEHCLRLANT